MATPITPTEISRKLVTAESRGDYYNAGAKMSRDFASLFGASFDDTGAVSQASQGASNMLGYSIFSGFATEIGARQNFDCVKFSLYPHDAAYLPTQCRVAIRNATYDGTILANVLLPLPNVSHKQSFEITAELGAVIANAGASQIVLCVSTNGYVGYGSAGENPVNRLQYITSRNADAVLMPTVASSDQPEIYAKTFLCGSRNPFSNGIFGAIANNYSTFSGWGSLLSSKPSGIFNVVQLWINAFDADFLPSRVRVRFRDGGYAGEVIATATAYVAFSGVGTKLVTLYFAQDVDVSSYGNIWVEYVTDGRVSLTQSAILSTPSERYTTAGGIDSNVATAIPSPVGRQPWIRCIWQARTSNVTFDAGQLSRAIQSQSAIATPFVPAARLNLPPKIYAVEGIESNIYWDGCFDASIPHEMFDKNIGSTFGQQLDNRWRFTPIAANAGTSPLSFAIDFNRTEIINKTTSLVCKTDAVGSGQTRKVLVIGDSLVNAGTITQTILDNVAASASSYAVTLLGTTGTGPNLREGRGGWTLSQYASSGSPFWISGSLNFTQYLTDNSYTMAATDSIFIQLGTNDFFSTSRTNIAATITTALGHLGALITSMQAAVPGDKYLGMPYTTTCIHY
jgi:lysophospholipase L1-like esterase